MAVEVRVETEKVSVRCVGWTRWFGIAFATLVGVAATASMLGGMTEEAWAPAIVPGVIGLLLVQWTLTTSAASVEASHEGLRIRWGLLPRRVAAGDIERIGVIGPTFGSRLVLVVTRRTGQPRRIRTVQQICTTKNRRALESAAVELSEVLGLNARS